METDLLRSRAATSLSSVRSSESSRVNVWLSVEVCFDIIEGKQSKVSKLASTLKGQRVLGVDLHMSSSNAPN